MILELAKVSYTHTQMSIINEKGTKLGNTKIKNFCSPKYTIKGVKRQPNE